MAFYVELSISTKQSFSIFSKSLSDQYSNRYMFILIVIQRFLWLTTITPFHEYIFVEKSGDGEHLIVCQSIDYDECFNCWLSNRK